MGKQPAFQFYPGDYIQDTRILTPASRGIWMDMLCFMWRSDDRGKLEGTRQQLARMTSCSEEEFSSALQEVSVTKIADVTERNDLVTIVNRRMFREERERKLTRCRVERYRNAGMKRECNDDVTPPSSSSTSSSIHKLSKDNLSNRPGIDEPEDTKTESKKIPDCPHSQIIEIYHEVLPELPKVMQVIRDEKRVYSWKGQRMKDLATRWKEDDRRQNLPWWRKFFEYISRSDFLCGRSNSPPGKHPFTADLGWIVKYANFEKIRAGNYHR